MAEGLDTAYSAVMAKGQPALQYPSQGGGGSILNTTLWDPPPLLKSVRN